MKRVKGVEDLNICIIGAQGIVGVGATVPLVRRRCLNAESIQARTTTRAPFRGPTLFS